MLLGVLVVGGLVVSLMVLLDPFGSKDPGPMAVAPMSQAPKTVEPVAPSTAAPEPTPSAATETMDPQAEALKKLRKLRSEEAGAFGSLMDRWGVQLASAKIGADDKAFLSKYESLGKERKVFLTTTEHFDNRRETGDKFWVVFSGKGFESKEQAEAWCADQGLGEGDFQLRELQAP
ncbi:hypothetical protein GCM10023166_05270 [Paeniglutamicibacter cryotolerans]